MGTYKIEMEIPGKSPWKGDVFYQKYNLLQNVHYSLTEADTNKVYFGEHNERKCALCGYGKDKVTFKKKSHLLPEALGNKKYFSNEECDACNERFGEEYEDPLAVMLNFQRTFLGVRGKPK